MDSSFLKEIIEQTVLLRKELEEDIAAAGLALVPLTPLEMSGAALLVVPSTNVSNPPKKRSREENREVELEKARKEKRPMFSEWGTCLFLPCFCRHLLGLHPNFFLRLLMNNLCLALKWCPFWILLPTCQWLPFLFGIPRIPLLFHFLPVLKVGRS